mmetsp:Transcript_35776/g.83196  ORF Transcript_35776/g.83196 Transcript_35776/m.83196 type:complete len:287 (+) Transcript_35776:92-952(+)|eukprot:CAMPEP_0171095860 /NCGR_PEP_ID=MMETSP0766_2-20121228/43410_1 /TAXON_ID=439317 /ORGANISM="Gambierdiscus australes, Strain CAWD 149" /LENGTH=286 /DNA_ID=CAMNT_0011554723 /DNA_START=86 /DNA_END=946 /DNA_ORIENTATION=-
MPAWMTLQTWFLTFLSVPVPAIALASTSALGSSAWSGGSLLAGLRQMIQAEPNEAQQALRSLDTNGDGRVGFDEVAAFAKSKGLDYSSTLSEFASFDADRDGSLDARELAGALGIPMPPAEPVPALPPAPMQVPAAPNKLGGNLLTLASHMANVGRLTTREMDAEPAASTQTFTARAASLAEVADGLDLEVRKEQEAVVLDRQAADLRAKAMELARTRAQEAREASALAAKQRAEELFKNITELEDKASRAEVAAAVLRAKVKAEMQEVDDISLVASSGIDFARTE